MNTVFVCVQAARPLMGSSLRQNVISHYAEPVLQPPLSVPASMTLSTSCPQHLDSRFLESSLDSSLQLTQVEIDAIRSLGRPGRGSGASSPSTPTSQLSHPDFDDPRPDIYRFVYDISPGSRSQASDSASVSAEGGDSRLSELQQDSKFDHIVIASMDRPANHHVAHRHKLKTVTAHESEGIDETSLKLAAETIESEPLPTRETTVSIHAALEPESHVAVASVSTPVQSSELVVSVGDALVTVQQTSELASEGSNKMQQPPVATATDAFTAGSSKSLGYTSSRFHKGSYISVLNYLILLVSK